MANNEEQNAIEQVKETKKMAEEGAKLAANIASTNFVGAAKNALNLLKNKQFRKILKKQIIMIIIQIMIPILIAICFFSLLNSLKDKVITFLSDTTNSIATFLSKSWQWLTDGNWIDLGKEMDYTTKDGETIKATIVDQYIYELDELGISLKDLRLLGDADYSNKEEILKNKDNKALVEKYIAEFIRADIITQQPHRRSGVELVDSNNQDKVDGGVYFYRTKKEAVIDEESIDTILENGIKNNEPVKEKDFKQMEYMDYEEFIQKLSNRNTTNELRYRFTIDPENGDLVMSKITSVETVRGPYEEGDDSNYKLSEWLKKGELKREPVQYTQEEERIPYKEYIAKYTMPYEFLINLCTITQNPEFVYHVALLARDSKIILVAQDNTTIKREITAERTDWKNYENSNNDSTSGATITDGKVERERTVVTTTTQTPVLKVEYADTWSFYEEFEYTKNITANLEPKNLEPKEDDLDIPEKLRNEKEIKEETTDETGNKPITITKKYYYDSFPVKKTTTTQILNSTTEYNEAKIKQSVEKSKQFLGLLRNSTGKCEIDCYKEDTWKMQTPTAYKCAKKAEFDIDGINVQYRIPNMTRTESPLNKLLSGLEMLYAVLQSNSSGYKEEDRLITNEQINQSYEIQDQYIANEDYESAYVVKMSGLVDHLRYLMTFPVEEESYTIKDLILDTIFGSNEGGNHLGFGYGFWWPTNAENSPITSPFGMRLHPITGINTMHKGIDIGIPIGTEVIATADGTVSFVGRNPDSPEGLWIKIDHGNGISSVYMHLSEIKVSVGQVVSQGEVIALSGNTGRSKGPHLHFGISVFGEYVDPLLYVSQVNKKPEKVEVGENIEEWRRYIETAFSELGYTMTEEKVTRILRQISRESSGRQNVIQGIKDSNSGTPITFNNGVCPWCPSLSGSSCENTNIGHGLLQFIPTTFESCKLLGFGDIFNGYHQICALIVNAEEKGRGNYNHIGNGTGWRPY